MKTKTPARKSKIRKTTSTHPGAYPELFDEVKERIRKARIKASLAVNSELVALYWDVGRAIVERQKEEGWGKAVVERLSRDLSKEFPGIKGFSTGNIWRMRGFYLAWAEENEILAQAARELDQESVQRIVGQIPWFHNVVLVEKIKGPQERLWYAQKTIENGWSRNVLVHQIESGLYQRKGGAVTNFSAAIPPPQSDLAREIVKDPYHFDFLELTEGFAERELERGLTEHVRDFLIELGRGFAFLGSQYHLEIGGEDFFLDLLFYHVTLRRYVVIELKTGAFKPEYAGKMNFYLAAIDDLMNQAGDQPAIGVILCKTKNRVIAEYALQGSNKPIGVSSYKMKTVRKLPKELKPALPTVRELEEELGKEGG